MEELPKTIQLQKQPQETAFLHSLTLASVKLAAFKWPTEIPDQSPREEVQVQVAWDEGFVREFRDSFLACRLSK